MLAPHAAGCSSLNPGTGDLTGADAQPPGWGENVAADGEFSMAIDRRAQMQGRRMGRHDATVLGMETPAEYFTRVKDNHRQALKMLGHPISRASKSSPNSTDASMKTPGRRTASSSSTERPSRAA